MVRFWLSLLMFLLSLNGYAYTGYSICNFGKQTVANVVCYTPTVMQDTMVSGDIKVTGSLQAERVKTKALIVDGNVDLSDTEIQGYTNIVGALKTNGVQFFKGVAVESDDISLSHTNIKGILTVTSKEKTPYVQLQCSSVITGAVLFDGKAGVVQVTDDSLVQGKVINGSLEFVKRKCE